MLIRQVKNKSFTNQTVLITGNGFHGCQFEDCTFVFHGFPFQFVECSFHGGAVWRIEITVHDPDQWDEFVAVLAGFITKTLPKTPPTDETNASR